MNKDSVYQQLRSHLAYLTLAAVSEALPTHLDQAHHNSVGHTEFLEALLRVEVETTEQRRWARWLIRSMWSGWRTNAWTRSVAGYKRDIGSSRTQSVPLYRNKRERPTPKPKNLRILQECRRVLHFLSSRDPSGSGIGESENQSERAGSEGRIR